MAAAETTSGQSGQPSRAQPIPGTRDSLASMDARTAPRVEREDPEVSLTHRERHIVDRDPLNPAGERPRVSVAMLDEISLMLQGLGPPDDRYPRTARSPRAALDRGRARLGAQRHVPQRAQGHVTQAPVQRLNVTEDSRHTSRNDASPKSARCERQTPRQTPSVPPRQSHLRASRTRLPRSSMSIPRAAPRG